MQKYNNLIESVKKLERAVVAFSGGVDSTFLAYVASEALGKNALAITIDTPYIPRWELTEAKELAKKIGINHKIIKVGIAESIKFNPNDRCYKCKKILFNLIKEQSEELGFNYVLDGSNIDDLSDYRPGMKALKELEVKSPLLEESWSKADIRKYSKKLGLNTYDKPAYACLLTRIQHETEITNDVLNKIEKAEVYMMNLGFKSIRVRVHGDLARIEVPKSEIPNLFDDKLLGDVAREIKEIGFKYVTLDISGYKMGSLNKI